MTYEPTSRALAAIVDELRASHRELIGFMDDVDRIADAPVIDGLALSSARWKLSQARRRNKLLLHALLDCIDTQVRQDAAELITALLSQSATVMHHTARHSSRWSLLAVTQEPRAYRDAIDLLRQEWIEVISLERTLIDLCSDVRSAAA